MFVQRNLQGVWSVMLSAAVCGAACSCGWMGDPVNRVIDDGVRVVVENNSFYDVNVYLARDGHLRRLGFVMSQQDGAFRITNAMLCGAVTYQLVANPVGSREKFVSRSIDVQRGGVAFWMLEPAAWLSYVVVR